MKLPVNSLLFYPYLLISCTYSTNIGYTISNNFKAPIKVICKLKNHSSFDTFTIPRFRTKCIAVFEQGNYKVSSYKEKDEYLRDFETMDIFMYDTIQSGSNFLKTDRWKYIEGDQHNATYELQLNNIDFK